MTINVSRIKKFRTVGHHSIKTQPTLWTKASGRTLTSQDLLSVYSSMVTIEQYLVLVFKNHRGKILSRVVMNVLINHNPCSLFERIHLANKEFADEDSEGAYKFVTENKFKVRSRTELIKLQVLDKPSVSTISSLLQVVEVTQTKVGFWKSIFNAPDSEERYYSALHSVSEATQEDARSDVGPVTRVSQSDFLWAGSPITFPEGHSMHGVPNVRELALKEDHEINGSLNHLAVLISEWEKMVDYASDVVVKGLDGIPQIPMCALAMRHNPVYSEVSLGYFCYLSLDAVGHGHY